MSFHNVSLSQLTQLTYLIQDKPCVKSQRDGIHCQPWPGNTTKINGICSCSKKEKTPHKLTSAD